MSPRLDRKSVVVTWRLPLLKWLMMDGGITPKSHPLDVLINKVFKGFFRDLFEEWSLNAPTNPTNGHPLAPSCQLLAQWIVKTWAKVPKELVRKSWEVCEYKSTEGLNNEEEMESVAVIIQRPSLLTYLLTKFSRDYSMPSLNNGR